MNIDTVRSSLSNPLISRDVLVGPEGKIISLGQTRKQQPALRGQALLKTLDELLPP